VCTSDSRTSKIDQGSKCSSATKPNNLKRKARRKGARKRTPKAVISPQKRSIRSDNIQENIQQLHEQFLIVIQDIDKVIVAIAPSTMPQAGLGLYVLSVPAEDGSAPPSFDITEPSTTSQQPSSIHGVSVIT